MQPIKVVIHGASGRVGQVLVNAFSNTPEIKLVGAVDIKAPSPALTLPDGSTIPFSAELEPVLTAAHPDVMVDFSLAPASMPAIRLAARYKVNQVIGTTGFTPEDVAEIEQLAGTHQIGIILASNFALGAVLMMYFARLAARFMDSAEIIELHHDRKLDAPSGTSITTARSMAEYRGNPFSPPADEDKNFPSRGSKVEGIPIHSVRLPGLMAHQEVIFGGLGQTLSIRHDTIGRECYVPGVLLAVKNVITRKGLVQGLENLLGL
jgi:4-hydroxy-tetrahydrodipicolinate reductase